MAAFGLIPSYRLKYDHSSAVIINRINTGRLDDVSIFMFGMYVINANPINAEIK